MFCDWLRDTRRMLGMTQRELGEILKISASSLGMYEQGRRRPGAAVRARMRCFFKERGIEMPEGPVRLLPPEERRFRMELVEAAACRRPLD